MKNMLYIPKVISVLLTVALLLSFIPARVVVARADSFPELSYPEESVSGSPAAQTVQASSAEATEVPLITGDTVIVSVMPDGTKNYGILPAENQTGHDYLIVERTPNPSSETDEVETITYVLPNDIDLSLFDMELFNISYLVEEKYHELPYIPVLIVEQPQISPAQIEATGSRIATAAEEVSVYNEFMTTAARFTPDNAPDAWSLLNEEETIEKVWLDRKVRVNLADSVPLIGAPNVWSSGYTGDGITIAVLDTGIDDTHPDLDDMDDNPATTDPKVLLHANFTDDPSVEDMYGHGTHCAAIAAGTGTYPGVAPGARLYNVKVLNQNGSGATSWIIDGINYAVLGPDGIADTGDEADVINMSLGSGPGDGTDPLSLAVNWAVAQGVVVAISAGNSGPDYLTAGAPGVASDVITVGATDKSDIIASFSSRGPTMDFRVKPDVTAPGVSIVAARAAGTSMGTPVNEYYTSAGGTSMAAPHVAGAAALILEANPAIPFGWDAPEFVKNTLMSNAVDLGYDVYTQGAGRIYLPPSTDPVILVDPPTTSFGIHSGQFLCTQQLTFYNTDSVSHELTLFSGLTEIYTSSDNSGRVTLTPSILTVPAGGSAATTLEVDTVGIAKGLYSGKVMAAIDTGGGIQAVFGFGILNELTVNKIDMDGNPGVGHYISVFSDTENLATLVQSGITGETGSVTFLVPDSDYHVISGALLTGST